MAVNEKTKEEIIKDKLENEKDINIDQKGNIHFID